LSGVKQGKPSGLLKPNPFGVEVCGGGGQKREENKGRCFPRKRPISVGAVNDVRPLGEGFKRRGVS